MPGQSGHVTDQQADPRGEAENTGRTRGGAVGERVTVNLSARASRALEQVTALTGDSKTDAISRALSVYAFFEETTANGGSLYIQESKDAPMQLVKIF
jgi:hypothetical protein